MSNRHFPVSSILVGNRKRHTNADKVAALADSIKQVGLLNPLTITQDGRLIAGLHRLEAVQSLGWLEVPVYIVTLDELQAELAEIDENLVRHQLDELQESIQIFRRKQIYEALYPQTKNGANGHRGSGNGATISRNDMLTFSEDTASKMSKSRRVVERKAFIGSVLADVDHRLEDTAIAGNQRALLTLAQMEEDEREEVIELLETREARTIGEAQRLIHQVEQSVVPDDLPADLIGRCQFICGELADIEYLIPDESVDAIITSPPATIEAYETLAMVAARVLVPGGSLLCTVNQSLLPAALPLLMACLSYQWTIAIIGEHPKASQQRSIRTSWQPALWLTRGDYCGYATEDTAKSLASLIEHFTKPGDTILDPFMGSGAIVIPAVQMNRKVIGVDTRLEALETTLKRLGELQTETAP
jgi:ParB-like chromosome segregation protein Spo0J